MVSINREAIKSWAFAAGAGYLKGHPEIILNAAREILIKKMQPITQMDIIRAIQDDTSILANIDLAKETKKYARLLNTETAQRLIIENKDRVTAAMVFDWLRAERPDLAGIILNFSGGIGMQWFDRQVEEIKKGLFGYPVPQPKPVAIPRPVQLIKLTKAEPPKQTY